jgi:hypothetical protein
VSDEVMMDIQRTLGRVETKVDGSLKWLEKHATDIKELQLAQARQKGALKVLGIVGSTIGAGVGYLVERITLGHHN